VNIEALIKLIAQLVLDGLVSREDIVARMTGEARAQLQAIIPELDAEIARCRAEAGQQ
jgi:hypothetical protein